MNFYVPEGYVPKIDLRETQIAIKIIKDFFQRELTRQLHLTRVSAPLFVTPDSGLNDNLNGVERPVAFDLKEGNRSAEIVHSLAKWKRYALKQYGFLPGEGLYTDMNAIRRDEDTDNIHSIYVDQWDWEKVIRKEERTRKTLEDAVRAVYKTLKITEDYMTRSCLSQPRSWRTVIRRWRPGNGNIKLPENMEPYSSSRSGKSWRPENPMTAGPRTMMTGSSTAISSYIIRSSILLWS